MSGKVYLVGAGPGDPDLLTLKAARVLRQADVVLHDDLVSTEILALAAATAELRNVGKRCGQKRITQDEVNQLMVEFASQGLQVVRLKSGDPLLFGRVSEEIDALRQAGIEHEIVPGITSALGAASAVETSLTRRGVASATVLMTAHHATERPTHEWTSLVTSGATLVIYMPGDYRRLSSRLIAAGLDPELPCAVVANATTAAQEAILTSVGDLAHVADLPAPSLVIVGRVLDQSQLAAHLSTRDAVRASTKGVARNA